MLRALPPALDPPCEEDIELAAQGDMLATSSETEMALSKEAA